jgi:hypothetical protein
MRIIKLGLISIVFFAILLTLISFFFPSHVRISRATDIRAEKNRVLATINDVTGWRSWFPGADSTGVYEPAAGKQGLERSLLGSIELKAVSDSSLIATNRGPGSGEGEMGWNVFPANTPGTTTVQWYMDVHFRWYPWEKFSSLLLEKRYGPVMEKGLDNLKRQLEAGDNIH